jgi:hypothetical protein
MAAAHPPLGEKWTSNVGSAEAVAQRATRITRRIAILDITIYF